MIDMDKFVQAVKTGDARSAFNMVYNHAWDERKEFESEILDAITEDLKGHNILTKEHSDALLQVRADLGNDGARFEEE